jgi:hypothetical protein
MKKLMITTAIASSLLMSSAIAQTTITGEARVNYKSIETKKGAGASTAYGAAADNTTAATLSVGNVRKTTAPTQAATATTASTGTADNMYGFGTEQQINVQTKGKLTAGGLDYAAGFSIENDGDQLTSLFNENAYFDITNGSSGTTISISRDHIQRSDSDRSAAVLVGFSPNDLSQATFANTTLFQQNIGALPGQVWGVAILQKTPFGTFSYNYAPENAAPSVSEDVNQNTKGAQEYGFVGDLGVKGLNAYYFKNKDLGTVTTTVIEAEGKSFGASYNFGEVSVGYADKKYNPAAASGALLETKEKHYGLAYAVNKDLTIGALYAKANQTGGGIHSSQTGTQKVKAVQVGYALGPVDLTASYAKNTDMLGVSGNDTDAAMVRLIGKF